MASTMIGQNFTAVVEKGKLVVTINLEGETTVSGSGKSDVIASTRGNKQVPGTSPVVYIGLNVYTKK